MLSSKLLLLLVIFPVKSLPVAQLRKYYAAVNEAGNGSFTGPAARRLVKAQSDAPAVSVPPSEAPNVAPSEAPSTAASVNCQDKVNALVNCANDNCDQAMCNVRNDNDPVATCPGLSCNFIKKCCDGQCADENFDAIECLIDDDIALFGECDAKDFQCNPGCDLGVFDFFGLGVICFFLETFASINGCIF